MSNLLQLTSSWLLWDDTRLNFRFVRWLENVLWSMLSSLMLLLLLYAFKDQMSRQFERVLHKICYESPNGMRNSTSSYMTAELPAGRVVSRDGIRIWISDVEVKTGSRNELLPAIALRPQSFASNKHARELCWRLACFEWFSDCGRDEMSRRGENLWSTKFPNSKIWKSQSPLEGEPGITKHIGPRRTQTLLASLKSVAVIVQGWMNHWIGFWRSAVAIFFEGNLGQNWKTIIKLQRSGPRRQRHPSNRLWMPSCKS